MAGRLRECNERAGGGVTKTGTEDHEPSAEIRLTIFARVGNDTYELGDRVIYGPDTSHAQVAQLLRDIADEVERP